MVSLNIWMKLGKYQNQNNNKMSLQKIELYVTPEVAANIKSQIENSEKLSLEEVAKLSGSSLRTIQRHVKDKILEYEYYNGKKVVTKENFNNYLKR